MTAVLYSPDAFDDVQEILAFLQQQRQPELVEKFEADYRKALKRIRAFPQGWPKLGRRIRVKIISKRFLYGIYYEYSKKTIYIGAVCHLMRRSRWKRRFGSWAPRAEFSRSTS